jgi:hypothetical protein
MAAASLLLVGGDASAAGKVIEAHSGSRQGTVYEATPQPYASADGGRAGRGAGAQRRRERRAVGERRQRWQRAA